MGLSALGRAWTAGQGAEYGLLPVNGWGLPAWGWECLGATGQGVRSWDSRPGGAVGLLAKGLSTDYRESPRPGRGEESCGHGAGLGLPDCPARIS